MIKIEKVKNKEKIMQSIRGKQLVIYKRNSVRQSVDFSAKLFRPDIFKVLSGKNLQPIILLPVKDII